MNAEHKFTMKLTVSSLLGGCLLMVPLMSAPEDFRIEKNPAQPSQPLELKWWGNPGVYYVVESSLDLMVWDSPFHAVKGVPGLDYNGLPDGQPEGVAFAPLTGTNKAFFRLRGESDPLSRLALTDHDGDGIATALELDAGMNAVVAETVVDSDSDGLPDYWENFYFGDLSRDGSGDFDGDGLVDRLEWQARTNPAADDASRAALRDEFAYDDRGWLDDIRLSGSPPATLTYDPEGNATTQN